MTAIRSIPACRWKRTSGQQEDRQPGVFLRRFGKGRVVYFPWDIDRVYWEVMVDDHGRLLRNAIDWALNEERPVIVDGPGVLDVTMWKQKNSMTVHMVNLTNPMMMRPSFREMIAVSAPAGSPSSARGQARLEGSVSGRRDGAARTDCGRRDDLQCPVDSGSRGDRDRLRAGLESGLCSRFSSAQSAHPPIWR